MASQVTVTGKYGPGLTATATVITGVVAFGIDTEKEILTVNINTGEIRFFDIAAATTITVTVSGNTYTVTIA